MQREIAELRAMFGPQITATTTEYRLPREIVDRLLTTAGLADIEPAAIPDAFDELARRFAAMRDTLQQQRNDDPEIAALKKQASAALTAADLYATERLLGAIRLRQRTLSEHRRRTAEAARADLIAALEDEAETCTQQADAALLRSDAATALRFYRDGIAVLTGASPAARWRYTLQAADSLQEFGNRAGHNEALLASIELYKLALRTADRDRVPLDWAVTQANLGNALLRLGERESGTARLEEAVAAYRAALEEYTPQTDPTNYQRTMKNLDQVLTLLKKKSGKKDSVH
jgi:hypothetical protein